jgi:hypothetical protein
MEVDISISEMCDLIALVKVTGALTGKGDLLELSIGIVD